MPDTPEHIELAERLGYRRAWVYDTPALQLDVWMTLTRAAERTRTIGLGPGVLIPSLRHVLVTASAVATLIDMAPGRVNVGIGSGFTGRLAMGQRSNLWSFVAQYARQLRALLAGEAVEVDGALTRMIHGPGQAPPRPIRVPMVFGTRGPKGETVARELGDGVFTVTPPPASAGRLCSPSERSSTPASRSTRLGSSRRRGQGPPCSSIAPTICPAHQVLGSRICRAERSGVPLSKQCRFASATCTRIWAISPT